MKTHLKQGFTLIELLVVITIIAILASLAVPTFSRIQEKGNITKAISNCRQIITAQRLYASDNNGNYSDQDTANPATDANGAFRTLFIVGVLEDEKIFGCPASLNGNPDGNIGTNPTYAQALEAGENHWMMTAEINDSASGSIPFVFENATNAVWNPTWDADAAGRGSQGRTWSGGKVVVGKNDSSVTLEACTSTKGSVTLKNAGTTNLFTAVTGTAPTVLGIKAKQ